LRSGKPCLTEAADTLDPLAVHLIEVTKRFLGGARVIEGRNVRRLTAKVGPVRLRESKVR
jgi:hypothetical protein